MTSLDSTTNPTIPWWYTQVGQETKTRNGGYLLEDQDEYDDSPLFVLFSSYAHCLLTVPAAAGIASLNPLLGLLLLPVFVFLPVFAIRFIHLSSSGKLSGPSIRKTRYDNLVKDERHVGLFQTTKTRTTYALLSPSQALSILNTLQDYK